MNILAVDLGKFKSVACLYFTDTGEHSFTTFPTKPQLMHDLLVEHQPDRLVIEVSHIAGWICDMAQALNIETQVANPCSEGWRWNRVKRKTDRDDALKLAKLSAMEQIPLVHIPARNIRQWRGLITYRHNLVARRVAIKNSIRAIVDAQGISLPTGNKGWTRDGIKFLTELSQPIEQVDANDLWRGQLHSELIALHQVQALIEQVESRLDALGAADTRVKRLRTVPGVGARLGELIVAWIDDPHRFKTNRQVGAYAGLTPKQHQSGTHDRLGRITRQGPGLMRKLLVEVAWAMRRHNPYANQIFERLCKGQKTKRKQAAVSLARRILIWCWAMLRDERDWQPPGLPLAACHPDA